MFLNAKYNIYEDLANLHRGNKSKEYEMDDTRKAFKILVEELSNPLGRIRRNGKIILQSPE
jgi:hypothetical protein